MQEQAYVAWLGFYNGHSSKMGWSKAQLVEVANKYALEALGCPGLPAILKKTIGMMGLKVRRCTFTALDPYLLS